MTYNIRYATVNDQENQWEKRKEYLTQQIDFYTPDVFGIQEGLHSQLAFINEALSSYAYIGVGRDDGKKKGEYCAVGIHGQVIYINRSADTVMAWFSSQPGASAARNKDFHSKLKAARKLAASLIRKPVAG